MKSRVLIIIGMITIIVASLSYFAIYDNGSEEVIQVSIVIIPKGSYIVDNNLTFEPEEITVVIGVNNTLMWLNQETTPIFINSVNGNWTQLKINPNESEFLLFVKSGIYEYFGHPWMQGKVVVLEFDDIVSKPKTIFCDNDFTQQENNYILDPKSIEPNTIVIYDVTENTGTRLAISPSTLVIDFEENNTITWLNQGICTATVTDRERGLWGIDEIKLSTQKSIQFNNTGFYSFLVVAGIEGKSGRIVVLGDDIDSLSVGNRIKMAKAIISNNFRENPELVGVGGGGAEIGVHITINEKELELYEDAKSYYYEKYSEMIPFDVPIIIEFDEPIRQE